MSLGISLLINILFVIMFFYGRDSVFPPGKGPPPSFQLSLTLLHIAYNFLVAFILYLLTFYLLKKDFSSKYKWLIIIPVVFIASTLISYLTTLSRIELENIRYHNHLFLGSLFRDYFITVIVLLSSQLFYLSYHQQQTILENQKLLSENIRSRFLALKNQMDPHFLFNSLNTLNSLIKIDGDKAQEYVQQLSSVFRYTLQNRDIITLEEELKFSYSYCHLMQIRYGDSLKFEYHIEERFYSYLIIPLSLQVLVENAIKHNVISNKQPLTIRLFTSDNEYITVSNPVQPKKEPEKGQGIALANLEERYELMWKKNITIHSDEKLFEVSIPLVKKEKDYESFNY